MISLLPNKLTSASALWHNIYASLGELDSFKGVCLPGAWQVVSSIADNNVVENIPGEGTKPSFLQKLLQPS
jgi:hypothetical protein